jgi:multiple sugar transport system substrate-binding protein
MAEQAHTGNVLSYRMSRRTLGRLAALASLSSIGAGLMAGCAQPATPTTAPEPTKAPAAEATKAPVVEATKAPAAEATKAPVAEATKVATQAAAKEPQTVIYGEAEVTAKQLAFHKEMTEVFNKQTPGIKVEFREYAFDKTEVDLAAGTAPDVTHNYWTLNAGPAGQLVDIKPYLDADTDLKANHVAPSIFELGSYKGKYYMFPRNIDGPWTLLFNKKIFDDAKVAYPTNDWTWDDYTDAAVKLTKKDGDRFTILGTMPVLDTRLGITNGLKPGQCGLWNMEGTKAILDLPELREMLTILYGMRTKLKILPDQGEITSMGQSGGLYETGRVAMSIGSGYWSTYAQMTNTKIDSGQVLVPHGKGKPRLSYVGAFPSAISKTAKFPDACYQFLRFYCSHEGWLIEDKHFYSVPNRKDDVAALAATDKPLAVACKGLPDTTAYSKYWNHCNEWTSKEWSPRSDKVLQGDMELEKALDEAQAAFAKYVPANW